MATWLSSEIRHIWINEYAIQFIVQVISYETTLLLDDGVFRYLSKSSLGPPDSDITAANFATN